MKQLFETDNLSYEELVEQEMTIDWNLLSNNENIKWDKQILDRYKFNLNWERLAQNNSIDWKNIEFLEIAADADNFFTVLRKAVVKWDEADYLELKKTSIYRDSYKAIQDQFLYSDINWEVTTFIQEFKAYREDVGPFIESDFNSYTNDYDDVKMYGSKSSFDNYCLRLESVFENYFASHCYSLLNITEAIEYLNNWFRENSYFDFEKKKMWETFSKSKMIPFSFELINKFKENLHWHYLLANENIMWTIDSLEAFYNLIDEFEWENDFDESLKINGWNGLIINPKLPIPLKDIALNYSPFWKYLFLNKGILINASFIEYLTLEVIPLIANRENESIEYIEKLIFSSFHKIKLAIWTEEILYRYKNILNWNEGVNYYENGKWKNKTLGYLDNFFYSENFINDFSDKIDFKKLSRATNVQWSKELILKYKSKFHFDDLKKNSSVNWSKEFDKIFEEHLEFKQGNNSNDLQF